eukprot:868889-Amphidinium_carterae.2
MDNGCSSDGRLISSTRIPKHMRKHRKLLLGRLRRALEAAVLLTCAFSRISTLITSYDQVMHASAEATPLKGFDCLPTFVDIERSETHWREISVAAGPASVVGIRVDTFVVCTDCCTCPMGVD